MAHIAGLVAGGAHPSPFPHAHVVTTTTHKSLRGPRSGMILWNDEECQADQLGGVPRPAGRPADARHRRQGGGLRRGAAPEFKAYAASVVENAKALAASLEEAGLRIVSGGTDNHLMLVDLTPKDVTGKAPRPGSTAPGSPATRTASRSTPAKALRHLGIRLGTPAGTTRGFGPSRVPRNRRTDRRSRRRAFEEWRRGRRSGRRERPPPGWRTVRRLPSLPREITDDRSEPAPATR
jgi:glycine hydroxymethyltransferase